MNFVIRRAGRGDLPDIQQLFVDAEFLSSGPPNPFEEADFIVWLSDRVSMPLVACPVEDLTRIVGFLQMSRKVTPSRASRAELEDVCLHPGFTGRGVASALLMHGWWWAGNRWHATRAEWISENTPKRADARARYLKLGAELVPGTDSCFRLKLPYTPPDHLCPHFKSVYD